MRWSRWVGIAAVAASVGGTAVAQGQSLTNGGFEAGLTGWTIDASDCTAQGTPYAVTVTNQAHTGTHAAQITATNCNVLLTQTVNVISGHSYQLDIWHKWLGGAATTANIHAAVGTSLACASDGYGSNAAWLHDVASGVSDYCGFGTDGTVVISVGGYNNAGAVAFDDIAFTDVTAADASSAPEPASLALLGTGLVGLAPLARRRPPRA